MKSSYKIGRLLGKDAQQRTTYAVLGRETSLFDGNGYAKTRITEEHMEQDLLELDLSRRTLWKSVMEDWLALFRIN